MNSRLKRENTRNKAKLKVIEDTLFNKKNDWKTSQVSKDRLLTKVDNAFKNALIDGRTYDYYLRLIFHTNEYP